MEEEPAAVDAEPAAVDTEPAAVDTEPAAVEAEQVLASNAELLQMSDDDVRGLRVAELRELLASLDQPASGKKADLIERIIELRDSFKTGADKPTDASSSKRVAFGELPTQENTQPTEEQQKEQKAVRSKRKSVAPEVEPASESGRISRSKRQSLAPAKVDETKVDEAEAAPAKGKKREAAEAAAAAGRATRARR